MYGGVCGEGLPRKKKRGSMGGRDALEKGKYLPNSYTAARVNVYYKLSSFFQCYFRSRTEILMAVCLQLLDFFTRDHSSRGTSYFNDWEVHFQWGIHIHFRWRMHPIGVASALMGGGQKNS